MKSLTQILILVFVLMFCSTCASEPIIADNSMEETEAANSDNNDGTESNDNSTEVVGTDDDATEEEGVEESGPEMIVLDKSNVNSWFSASLGEVIDILGPNYSEPYFTQGSTCVEYPGLYNIYFIGGIGRGDPQILPDGVISAVRVFQEMDVYKGISIGKTLEEINSNTDLKNKFEIDLMYEMSESGAFGTLPGLYEYNGNIILIWIGLDETIICREIFLKLETQLSTSIMEV